MNKQHIIDKLKTKLAEDGTIYPKWELSKIVEPFLEIVMETLNRGEDVQISNFGKFTIEHKGGQKYYCMKSEQMVISSPKRVVAFTPNRKFNAVLQQE